MRAHPPRRAASTPSARLSLRVAAGRSPLGWSTIAVESVARRERQTCACGESALDAAARAAMTIGKCTHRRTSGRSPLLPSSPLLSASERRQSRWSRCQPRWQQQHSRRQLAERIGTHPQQAETQRRRGRSPSAAAAALRSRKRPAQTARRHIRPSLRTRPAPYAHRSRAVRR